MEQRLRRGSWKPVPAVLRPEPEARKRLSAPALRAFFPIASAWGLSVAEQRALLGWPPPSTFHKYKSGHPGALSFDTLTRVSLVLGIYKDLQLLYPEPALADSWIRRPNTNVMFGGLAPIALMTGDGIDGLYRVRRLLDGRRG